MPVTVPEWLKAMENFMNYVKIRGRYHQLDLFTQLRVVNLNLPSIKIKTKLEQIVAEIVQKNMALEY